VYHPHKSWNTAQSYLLTLEIFWFSFNPFFKPHSFQYSSAAFACSAKELEMKSNVNTSRTVATALPVPANAVLSALALGCAVALSIGTMKSAHASVPTSDAIGSAINVSIVDRHTGRELPIYRYRGEYWVAGTPGAKYSVSVRNRIDERVLAVVSVDGVNVLSGETAGVTQQGYVFNRYQRYDVSGWRKSDHEVAAFTFVASPKSYAERTGRPDHVGTIGVALFREKPVPQWSVPEPRYDQPDPRWPYRYERNDSKRDSNESEKSGELRAQPAPAAPALPQSSAPSADSAVAQKRGRVAEGAMAGAAPQRVEEKLGTGHGAREYDTVTRTTFERATRNPSEVIRIRYDSRDNLIAMGVIPEPRRPWDRSPNPFPESYGQNQYVPDPPRWWR
jgi:hypothetical protein